MAPRALLLSSFITIATASVVLFGQNPFKELRWLKQTPDAVVKNYTIDTSGIPFDTISITDSSLKILNGIFLFNNKRYSGIIKEYYPNGLVKNLRAIFHGELHGTFKSFYENGAKHEVRSYKNNLATGRHRGYWPDGKTLQFDYNYYEEKREGQQRKWYKSGKPYIFSNYTNDHEDGLQRAWRENGKLYINYVAKDWHTYGLQQTALCYTLLDEKIKTASK